MAEYERLRAYAGIKVAPTDSALDTYLVAASQEAMNAVGLVSGRSFTLTAVPPEWPGADQAWSEGPASISVGLVMLRNLDAACLSFANLLLDNYYVQQLGLGPTVPLPVLIGAREFPGAALELYAANMLPKAADPQGGVRSDFESVMASLMFGQQSYSLSDLRKMHGRLPKRFGLRPRRTSDDDLAPLRGEPLPHVLYLYGRLFSDALTLIIAHEASHLLLGHLDADPSSPQRSREEEVEADRHATALLEAVPDFNLRSATLLFAFLQSEDRTENLADLTHPFAADRLAVLAASLSTAQDERLVADVNAGFALLRKPIALQAPAAIDGAQASLEAWATSDLYQSATLTVDLRLPPSDNAAAVVPSWEVVASLHLRDRVNPAVVHRTGTAIARFDTAAFSDTRGADGHTETFSFAFAAPPSWWLDLDTAVLEIVSAIVRVVPSSSARTAAVIYNGQTPEDADLQASFQTLAARAPQAAIRAAHRAMDTEPDARSIAFVRYARSELGDRDVRVLDWLAQKLIDGGDSAAAVALLRDALASQSYIPAELRLLLAGADWQLFRVAVPQKPALGEALPVEATRLYDEAYDLTLRGLNMCIDDTAKHQAALQARAMATDCTPTPAVAKLLDGMAAHAAGVAAMQKDVATAAGMFAQAVAAFEAAFSADGDGPVIALQLAGEASTARAATSDRDFGAAEGYFRRVLEADPSFLPAFTELAKIGLEREDYPAVREALAHADALSPAHPFLDYVRREYDRRMAAFVDAQTTAASAALDAGDAAKAMAAAEQLAQIDPTLSAAFNLRAIAAYALGDLPAARDAMRAYIAAEGEDMHSLTMLGQIQLELSAVHDAWETLSMALGDAEHQVKAEDITASTTGVIPYSDVRGRSFAKAARAVAQYALGDGTAALADAAHGFPTGGICLLDCAEVKRLAGDAEAARHLTETALAAAELPLPARLANNARAFLAGQSGPLLAANTEAASNT